mmetsp:Transcript_3355/g.6102  ORF Transcript_3355/g.6102 Transcript_3355/m.6102 type:complete len:114 (+) Transcript_3355:258-599(+)
MRFYVCIRIKNIDHDIKIRRQASPSVQLNGKLTLPTGLGVHQVILFVRSLSASRERSRQGQAVRGETPDPKVNGSSKKEGGSNEELDSRLPHGKQSKRVRSEVEEAVTLIFLD